MTDSRDTPAPEDGVARSKRIIEGSMDWDPRRLRMKVVEVEGIGPTYAEKLAAAGVATTEDLIDRGATDRGRSRLAAGVDSPAELARRSAAKLASVVSH
jgi:hypothetical protein